MPSRCIGHGQLVRLVLVHQQFAHALGFVIEAARLRVFGDVGVDEKDFAVLGEGVGFPDRRLAGAQRFHFGAQSA